MFNPSEELSERLLSAEVTDADVMEYLNGQHDALRDAGLPSPPVPFFYVENRDLDSFKQARAWWPTKERHAELPWGLVCPTLHVLCFNYAEGPPFAERLTGRSLPVVKWLQDNGLSIVHPNETDDDRKLRLNREAQRRFRARQSGQEDPRIKEAHEAYQEAMRVREEVLKLCDGMVQAAHADFMRVCEERKHTRAEQDRMVAEARAAWQALKNNPPVG